MKNILVIMAMVCALLMGAQSAEAQASVEIVAKRGDTISKLYEPFGIPAKDRKSEAVWKRTLVNGEPIKDVNSIRAGDVLTLMVSKEDIANAILPAIPGASIEDKETAVAKVGSPNTAASPATNSVPESTNEHPQQPSESQTPDLFLGNPFEPGLRPATELPNFAPVNREVEEGAQAEDIANQNLGRTIAFVLMSIAILCVVFEMLSSLGTPLSRTVTASPKPMISKEKLKRRTAAYVAEATKQSGRKPIEPLVYLKRLVANGARKAIVAGTKLSSTFTRQGVKPQKTQKVSKYAGRPVPVQGPKMQLFAQPKTSYTPPAQFAKANVPFDPDLPATDKEEGVLHQQLFGGEEKTKEPVSQKVPYLSVVRTTPTLAVGATPRTRVPVTIKKDFAQRVDNRVVQVEVEDVEGVPHFFWPGKGLERWTRAAVCLMLMTSQGQEHYKVLLKPLALLAQKAKLKDDPQFLVEGRLPGEENVKTRLEPNMALA